MFFFSSFFSHTVQSVVTKIVQNYYVQVLNNVTVGKLTELLFLGELSFLPEVC